MRGLAPCLTLTLMAVACDGPSAVDPDAEPADASVDGALDVDPPDASEPTDPVPWARIAVAAIDDSGSSDWLELPYPAEHRGLVVTVAPDGVSDSALCYRLEPVELASGAVLVDESAAQDPAPVCTACEQPVAVGAGRAGFVFSTRAAPLVGPDSLRFRVALRDCETGLRVSRGGRTLPDAVRVDAAVLEPVADDQPLRLALHIMVADDSGLADADALEMLVAVAAERFAAVDVELALDQTVAIGPQDVVRIRPDDRIALEALEDLALAAFGDDPRAVPVALVPCIELRNRALSTRSQPEGFADRIPGLTIDDRPAVLLVATGTCGVEPDGPDLERVGLVLAHELGHHLGLYHTDEPTGAALDGGDEATLMRSDFLLGGDRGAALFSPAEAAVMRRHPDLVP